MTHDEYQSLSKVQAGPLFTAESLTNKTPRTLLLGYTCDRESWHVYLGEDQKIHLVVYNSSLLLRHQTTFGRDEDLIPNKRLIPDACDFEACEKLTRLDVSLPFTTWDDREDDSRAFKGKVYEELKHLEAVYLPGHELAERFYMAVREANLNTPRAYAALVQACEELRVPYSSAPRSGVYVRTDQRKDVFERAEQLFPEAVELSDPNARVRYVLDKLNPFEAHDFPSFAHVFGGYLSSMISLDLAEVSPKSKFKVKKLKEKPRLGLFEGKAKEPFAWLTPVHKDAEGKQEYFYEERLFGEVRLRPLSPP